MSKVRENYGKLQASVEKRLRSNGIGWAFTPSDFAELGDPRSIGMVLTRLLKQGKIRRVQRGLYDIPHRHPIIGITGASTDALTQAIARKGGLQLLPSGASAANGLGLSTQVPAKIAYGVSGRSQTIKVGGATNIQLRRRSPRAMALAGKMSGWLAEALRDIGNGKIRPEDLKGLRSRLKAVDRKKLLKDIRHVPAWMRPYFKEVAGS